MTGAADVLSFWFTETQPRQWFEKSDAFDAQVRARFEKLATENAAVSARGSHPWETTAKGSLALILTLDQFSRNMYRGTPGAFAWDELALRAAKRAVKKSFDLQTPQLRRAFFYMPFMHSENLSDQNRCVELVDQRTDDPSTLTHARNHQILIETFGRFPHRNDILGRKSTPQEITFLNSGGYSP